MNQSRMIADEMAVFAQVVEHNGFTAAARRLKVPKVRVSRAVAALERALGVRLLGLDLPSVDAHDSKMLPLHHALWGAGVLILESLQLAEVPPGPYRLTALPLRIVGADASPVRAVLQPE